MPIDQVTNNNVAKFERFVMRHRFKKDEHDMKDVTHQICGMAWPYGKYIIPDDELGTFYKLYSKLVDKDLGTYVPFDKKNEKRKKELHFVERPCEIGPLLIDIDLKYGPSENTPIPKDGEELQPLDYRQYTLEDIKDIIERINRIVSKYYKTNSKKTAKLLYSYVFEKDEPSDKDGTWADGLHIVYPNLTISKGARFVILEELERELIADDDQDPLFGNISYINDPEDVVDRAVVSQNGWCMYGSKKQKGLLYNLTHVYDRKVRDIQDKLYPDGLDAEVLVRKLSNRGHDEEDELPVKSDVDQEDFDDMCHTMLVKHKVIKTTTKNPYDLSDITITTEDPESDSPKVRSKNKSNSKNKKKQKNRFTDLTEEEEDTKTDDSRNIKDHTEEERDTSDIDNAIRLTRMLSKKRATKYDPWIHVCWALKNIDGDSKDLLKAWIKFSQKCGNKFDKEVCKNAWRDAKCMNDHEGGYRLQSLHRWARKDNPEEYSEYMRTQCKKIFMNCIEGGDYYVAKIVFEYYKHDFRCIDIKKNKWFEFKKHRWEEIEDGYSLYINLAEDIALEFLKVQSAIFAEHIAAAAKKDTSKAEVLKKQADKAGDMAKKLRQGQFTNGVIKWCARLFYGYDPKFQEKLDQNIWLLGCNNGVIDLKNRVFRDGRPEDFISKSIGYNYKEYSLTDKYVQEVIEYFEQVQRVEHIRNYLLYVLASLLDGHIPQEMHIWIGSGANGKSTTFELIQKMLGDYACSPSVTLFTQKQGGASAASPEKMDLKGPRCVYCEEPEKSDDLQEGFIKHITGTSTLKARPLYGDLIEFMPQFTPFLSVNNLPGIKSNDGGIWRRLLVLAWGSKFVVVDKNGKYEGRDLQEHEFPRVKDLNSKFDLWKDRLLWYLLNYHYEPDKNKCYQIPDEVTAHTKRYREQCDTYAEFIRENYVETGDKHDVIDLKLAHKATFKFWFKEAYNRNPPPQKEMLAYFENSKYNVRNGCLVGFAEKAFVADGKDDDEDDDENLD
jgi:P4 family phage/plasmid primase-like protien